jgi:hypothetical protein
MLDARGGRAKLSEVRGFVVTRKVAFAMFTSRDVAPGEQSAVVVAVPDR